MSGFIEENSSGLLCFNWAKPIGSYGSTCECYVVQIDGKRFFMKRLRQEHINDQAYRALFRKEYEKGISMFHPNLVRYEKLIDSDNDCYILMENIAGETLDNFIKSHPDYFSSRTNLDKFFNQLLNALKCLHENHVVFSDLKPQNIMITQVNNDLKLIDLGFCFTDSYPDSTGSSTGFSAPEHIDKGKFDVTTDIYGVGKIIEYIGKNSTYNLSSVYVKIMMRCLKKRQQDRFQSTDEIVLLINRRKHSLHRIILVVIASLVLFITFKTLSYNETVLSWWDGLQFITPHVNYDKEYRNIYYRILSKEDSTCEAVGHDSSPNVYLHDIIVINNREYRLTHIGDSAFFRKKYVKSAYIPEGLLSIGKDAFRECSYMLSVNLPNSITLIDDYAFYGCNRLSYVNLPPEITMIAKCAFAGCNLTKIVIPEGVTIIKIDAFGNCSNLEHVTLPQSLVTMERGVFWNCSKLKQITIPKNVTSMGEYLLFGCDNLTDIYNMATEPQVIPPIHRNPVQITLHVPAESVEKYRNADFWKEMNITPIP